uniref:CSON012770 protein n=1 Tax=Culicoides sonorensis TaxID=179676 RepID=A0A336MAA2_CULSO
MSLIKRAQQWGTFAQVWHIYDCKWQNPFQSAELIKRHLLGHHKPIHHPLNHCGDQVVVINTKDIALPGNEWTKRAYFHHTGYPGGATWTLAWEMHTKDKTMIMKKAVYSAMRGNLQRRHVMERLHLFPDDKVPEKIMENISNQIRQPRAVPVRLDHIDKETIENFPQIMDYPKNYVIR